MIVLCANIWTVQNAKLDYSSFAPNTKFIDSRAYRFAPSVLILSPTPPTPIKVLQLNFTDSNPYSVVVQEAKHFYCVSFYWIMAPDWFLLYVLNHKYDICSCRSQSKDVNSLDLFVKTKFMKVYKSACHEDQPPIPIG